MNKNKQDSLDAFLRLQREAHSRGAKLTKDFGGWYYTDEINEYVTDLNVKAEELRSANRNGTIDQARADGKLDGIFG